MTSIPSGTYPLHRAALEEALADRKLTAAEVKKYVAPHRQAIAEDPTYRRALEALTKDGIPTDDGAPLRASFRAKRQLRKLVASAPAPISPPPQPPPPGVDGVRLTPADDGKVITVRQGQDLSLSFQGGAPDGVYYRVAGSLGPATRSVHFPDALTGGGVPEQRLSWRTTGEPSRLGKHTITVESGPAGADGRPAVSFTVTIDVVP